MNTKIDVFMTYVWSFILKSSNKLSDQIANFSNQNHPKAESNLKTLLTIPNAIFHQIIVSTDWLKLLK